MLNTKYIRVGNIESRKPTFITETKDIDIVYWIPNTYYNRENEYEWDKDGNAHPPNKFNITIDSECFKHPETCFSIANFVYNEDEPCYDLNYIGFRPFELSEKDFNDFLYVTKYIYNILKKELEND